MRRARHLCMAKPRRIYAYEHDICVQEGHLRWAVQGGQMRMGRTSKVGSVGRIYAYMGSTGRIYAYGRNGTSMYG